MRIVAVLGEYAPAAGRGEDRFKVELDYDIHVPLSAIPLGVNVGPSLEILSFSKDAKTGELPWIARRGWLAVGDKLVSLEGEEVSEVGCISVGALFRCDISTQPVQYRSASTRRAPDSSKIWEQAEGYVRGQQRGFFVYYYWLPTVIRDADLSCVHAACLSVAWCL